MKKVTLLDCMNELADNLDILILSSTDIYLGPDGEKVDSIAILVENNMNDIKPSDMELIDYMDIYGNEIDNMKNWVFTNYMTDKLN